jgi:hypothetical protein
MQIVTRRSFIRLVPDDEDGPDSSGDAQLQRNGPQQNGDGGPGTGSIKFNGKYFGSDGVV